MRSAVYKTNKTGPRTDPWGTPQTNWTMVDLVDPRHTCWCRPDRYDWNHRWAMLSIPNVIIPVIIPIVIIPLLQSAHWPSPRSPYATTHFPSRWGQEAEFASAYSRLETCSRLLANEITSANANMQIASILTMHVMQRLMLQATLKAVFQASVRDAKATCINVELKTNI